MAYKQLINSPITKSTTSILFPWIVNKQSMWYARYGGYHSGIDIKANSVYSYSDGVVMQIGTDGKTFEVSIQYDVNNIIRYMNLKNVSVSYGQNIVAGDLIGIAKDFVHFEHCTLDKTNELPLNMEWAIRLESVQYYKHDPEPLINGLITLPTKVQTDTNQVLWEVAEGDPDLALGDLGGDEFYRPANDTEM